MTHPGSSRVPPDTTGWYSFSSRAAINSVTIVNAVTEPETLSELIADCALIPATLQAESLELPRVTAKPWQVDEACHAQVAELDAYV